MIEIERVKKACEKEAFLMKGYTERERKIIKEDRNKCAGNFAAKEAVAKMLGTGFREIMLREIEVLRDEYGKPYVILYGRALKISENLGIRKIHLSISHTKDCVSAVAVGES